MPTILCTGLSEKIDEEKAKKSAFVSILKNLLIEENYPDWLEKFWIIHDENDLRVRTSA